MRLPIVMLIVMAQAPSSPPQFELVQPELFAAAGGQPNAWADIDGDGDLDLFVGFQEGKPNRLYRNDGGRFVEIAAAAGIADLPDTRAAAWGDFDGDGHVDLCVGFTRRSETRNISIATTAWRPLLDVAAAPGVDAGYERASCLSLRQRRRPDLFVAFRDAPNMLFRDGGGSQCWRGTALDDPRRTVARCGSISTKTATSISSWPTERRRQRTFRNDGVRFVDVAGSWRRRSWGGGCGSNGPSVADVDGDGHLDLFVAGYGGNFLYRNVGRGRFVEAAAEYGVQGGDKATPSRWGDYDNDGRLDLYVSSYVDQPIKERDFLFHRESGGRFVDVLPTLKLPKGATHGVQWVDFDNDGDLDLR